MMIIIIIFPCYIAECHKQNTSSNLAKKSAGLQG